eukprot:11181384-Heterocapsa_arctica.AAC.1
MRPPRATSGRYLVRASPSRARVTHSGLASRAQTRSPTWTRTSCCSTWGPRDASRQRPRRSCPRRCPTT